MCGMWIDKHKNRWFDTKWWIRIYITYIINKHEQNSSMKNNNNTTIIQMQMI